MPLAAPVTTSQLCCGHRPAERHGLLICRIVRPGAGRAEHGHLAPRAIGRENLEGVTQLAERAAEDFQIAARRVVGGQLVGRFLDLFDQVGHALPVEHRIAIHARIEFIGER